MDLLKTDASKFYSGLEASLPNRVFIFFGAFLAWWVAQYKIRLLMSPYIMEMRDLFSDSYSMFASHPFSQGLSVFFVSAVLLYIFIKFRIVAKPRFLGSLENSCKEGFFWGLITCVPVIPLTLSMGYKIGFDLDIQKILGNIISN